MVDILMPRLSDTMEEGVVNAWRKQVGDEVKTGDTLVEIETDKAVMEHESYDDGVLAEIVVAEGGTAPIGSPIAKLRTADEPDEPASTPTQQPAGEPAGQPAGQSAARPTPQPARQPVASGSGPERVLSSPLARRDAREHGIDLSTVTGTGPGGRIIRADITRARDEQAPGDAGSPTPQAAVDTTPAAATAGTAPAPAVEDTDEVVPLSSIRRTIARRLTESKQAAPHFYVTKTVDADPLMTMRAELNERLVAAGRSKVSVNDIVVRAAAVVLGEHPDVNSSFTGDAIVRHGRVHVGVAVATESGLVVPVVRDAHGKSLTAIATESRELAGRARDRKLGPDEMTGSTFTVSNLGMYGIDHFTAVINPPEAAILAVGAVRSEPGVRDGQVAVVQRMTMTLSADHRAVDGAQAAEFVRDLTAVLEDPWLAVA
ncbi:pyruvate dehydrogenase E2 component (dihydrolipoamide acetyltransferase) [Haloactinopolyspora alba]|uniref:Dihydrolipoamide acetyltransferase component of pyruvate dehydrogenase complex n=1 Tax=Haloactinopolyspora alba TaxID=648780 RepID=A0A2P8E737_9ACTN|nr:dihydrolipoamide acetyltransferase family protein [Haloactinopolyspora alba]PSL05280.1 pyruvate dehydrogenase E2 component (dihydrolipoamide acetyltransferase) [Haloactinopolyspora alba]